MTTHGMEKGLWRMLDANFNRSREGLRVCEDVCRFRLGAQEPAAELRSIRHALTAVLKSLPAAPLLDARDVAADDGKAFTRAEHVRSGWRDLYFANLQRSKEALRVLEETVKLSDPPKAGRLKKLRFRLYEHEKRIFKRF